MRFLIKRPPMKEITEELAIVMDVFMSDVFIMLDLFWFSVILTILLFPVIHSLINAIVVFAGAYTFFSFLYFYVVKRSKERKRNC